MIEIITTNSDVIKWKPEDYTDYKYDGMFFIIIRNGEYIGFYNLSYVVSIVIKDNNN